MKERPIIFSGPMVRAILDRRKAQTRRIINRLAGFGRVSEFGPSTTPGYDWRFRDKGGRWHDISHDQLLAACPWGQLGDRLWVRETWRGWFPVFPTGEPLDERWHIRFRADGAEHKTNVGWDEGDSYACPEECGDDVEPSVWRPSIHMPRWASRITLEITEVRAQRLQDISMDDAIAEGVVSTEHWGAVATEEELPPPESDDPDEGIAQGWRDYTIAAYRRLWDSINAPRGHGWDVNDWVFAVTFLKVKGN